MPLPLYEIYEQLAELEGRAEAELAVSVLRNVTVEPLEPYFRLQAARLGRKAVVRFGEYDNLMQEALGASSEALLAHADVVLVFYCLQTASPALWAEFPSLAPDSAAQEVERVQAQVQSMLAGIRAQTSAPVLWHSFETPVFPAMGLLEDAGKPGQVQAIQQLNGALAAALASVDDAYFVDMDRCLARVGVEQFYDSRGWQLSRAPYGLRGLDVIAAEQGAWLRALLGKTRKCLVLDCDNTLWGGVLGEEGPEGIALDRTAPGSCYFDFQQRILNLYNRGVILAINSKNNEADVLEVLREHPFMLLREEHFAAMQINWNDKATNLRRVAQELNIGLESLVFLDDSPFEVELVRRELPEVEAVLLPADAPADYAPLLESMRCFDTLTLSAEDRMRGAMYRAQRERKQLQEELTDMESYYRSLEMELTLDFATAGTVARISQQTLKTNQFNLTTRRYSTAEVRSFMEADDAHVVCVALKDRFGDMGVVGSCILVREGSVAMLDTFLLSCRAIGRGVELVFLQAVADLARQWGCLHLAGWYFPTPKNGQVASFYPDNGFVEDGKNAEGGTCFVLPLSGGGNDFPDYFKLITNNLSLEAASHDL